MREILFEASPVILFVVGMFGILYRDMTRGDSE
jgi:hypothetical protein